MTTTAEDVIKKSGNGFHGKVVNYFRDKGWQVTVSPYYNDNTSDKPREIDLIVEKKFEVHSFFNSLIGFILIRLFVECKYVNESAVVFWFDKKDYDKAVELITKETGLDPPKSNINIETNHHIQKTEVAKLFSSNQDSDFIYKATNQCLNATIYFENKLMSINHTNVKSPILQVINYPVIVCNSFEHFNKTNLSGTELSPIKTNFELEINYAYLGGNKEKLDKYFLIDIIEFDKIDEYLGNILDNDIEPIIQNESSKVRNSGKNYDPRYPIDTDNFY